MRLKLFENFDKSELDELFLNAKDCFSDFVDLTDDENVYDIIKDEEGIILFFKLETNYRTNSFDTFFKFKSSEFKIINDINICLERLKKVHHEDFDVSFETNVGDGDYEIVITIEPGSQIVEGSFYKKTRHGISIDYDKLRKIFKLNKNVEISLSTSGMFMNLSFEFKTSQDLDKYKDELIEDFMKLEIDGKKISGNIEWSYSTRTGSEMAPYKIYKDYKTRYASSYGSGDKIINSIEFGLSDDFKFVW